MELITCFISHQTLRNEFETSLFRRMSWLETLAKTIINLQSVIRNLSKISSVKYPEYMSGTFHSLADVAYSQNSILFFVKYLQNWFSYPLWFVVYSVNTRIFCIYTNYDKCTNYRTTKEWNDMVHLED